MLCYCKSSTASVNSTSLKWTYFQKVLEIALITVFSDWHWKEKLPLYDTHWLFGLGVEHPVFVPCLSLPSSSPQSSEYHPCGAESDSYLNAWMFAKRAAFCFSIQNLCWRWKWYWRVDIIITKRFFSQRETEHLKEANTIAALARTLTNLYQFISVLPAAFMFILFIVAPFTLSNAHTCKLTSLSLPFKQWKAYLNIWFYDLSELQG